MRPVQHEPGESASQLPYLLLSEFRVCDVSNVADVFLYIENVQHACLHVCITWLYDPKVQRLERGIQLQMRI